MKRGARPGREEPDHVFLRQANFFFCCCISQVNSIDHIFVRKDLIYYPLTRPPAGPRQKSITFIKAYMPYKSSEDPTNPSYRESKISPDQQKKSEDEEKATFSSAT